MNGLGIANLPDYLCGGAPRDGTATEVLADLPKQPSSLIAVYPGGRFTRPKVRAFIDFLVPSFAGQSSGNW